MANNAQSDVVSIEEYETNELEADDFGFVIGPDGELKSFMIPEHLMTDPPEEVLAILSIYGIDDITTLTNPTIH